MRTSTSRESNVDYELCSRRLSHHHADAKQPTPTPHSIADILGWCAPCLPATPYHDDDDDDGGGDQHDVDDDGDDDDDDDDDDDGGDDDGDDDDDSDDDERTLAPSGESLRVSTPENCVFACPCFFYPPYRSISHAARRGVAQVPSSSVRRLSSLFDERVTVGANELFPWLFF